MNKLRAVTTAGLAAFALSVALVGCGSDTKTESNTSTSTTTSTTTSRSAQAAVPNKTIKDYLQENKIVQERVHVGAPGSPTINMPLPPGWSNAGKATPDWAYGAIVYDTPADPSDPPSIILIFAKLTGNADPAQILNYAPGELKNLPGYEPLGDDTRSTVSGFDAIQLRGNYMKDGKKRIIAQKTVVIPDRDGLYVLQMNADALDGQESELMDATNVIDAQMTITP